MKQKIFFLFLLLFTLSIYSQWTEQNVNFTSQSSGVKFISIVDADIAWVCSYDGTGNNQTSRDFSMTTDGGLNWNSGSISAPTNLSIASISGIDTFNAWVILFPQTGQGGGVFHTSNGGITWSQQTTASFTNSSFPNVVYFWDSSYGVCQGDPVGGYFEIYTTSDGGNSWSRVPQSNIPAPLSGEFGYESQIFHAGTRVWFTTNKGRIFRSSNQGLNWEAFQSPISDFGGNTSSGEISFWDNDNGMLIDTNGSLWRTNDGAETWSSVYVDSGDVFGSDISCVPGTTNTVVSSGVSHIDNTVRGSSYSTDGGIHWLPLGNNNQIEVSFLNVNTGWAGGFTSDTNTGGIFKYTGTELVLSTINKTITTFKAYPNPVKNNLTIEGIDTITNVSIFNLLGQKVIDANPNNTNTIINTESLNKGTYFAKVTINGATETMKIIK